MRKKRDIPENALIQKSRTLYNLWTENFDVFELKTLDIYLAGINSHDENTRTVKIPKDEFEAKLGITRQTYGFYEKKFKNLLGHTITRVEDACNSEEGRTFTLFDSCAVTSDEQGRKYMELTCSDDAKKYIFNIESIGYIKYRLAVVSRVRNLRTYILFSYILQKGRNEWEEDARELQEIFGDDEKEYFRFYHNHLKKSEAELNDIMREVGICSPEEDFIKIDIRKNGKHISSVIFKKIGNERKIKNIENGVFFDSVSFLTFAEKELAGRLSNDDGPVEITKDWVKRAEKTIRKKFPNATQKQIETAFLQAVDVDLGDETVFGWVGRKLAEIINNDAAEKKNPGPDGDFEIVEEPEPKTKAETDNATDIDVDAIRMYAQNHLTSLTDQNNRRVSWTEDFTKKTVETIIKTVRKTAEKEGREIPVTTEIIKKALGKAGKYPVRTSFAGYAAKIIISGDLSDENCIQNRPGDKNAANRFNQFEQREHDFEKDAEILFRKKKD